VVVVVALAAPPSVTVTPDASSAGLTVPEMLNVFDDPVEAVKFTPMTWAPFTVTCWLAGLKLNPLLLTVIVYEPLARLPKL
jgi:hypothetical protein